MGAAEGTSADLTEGGEASKSVVQVFSEVERPAGRSLDGVGGCGRRGWFFAKPTRAGRRICGLAGFKSEGALRRARGNSLLPGFLRMTQYRSIATNACIVALPLTWTAGKWLLYLARCSGCFQKN